MTSPVHLTKEQVLEIHSAVLREHGGANGIREHALLESAIAGPQATFGGESLFTDLSEIAGAYLYYLCKNHPFVDGNKRAALASCLVFLRLNKLDPKPDSRAWEELVLDVAASRIDREETTKRLRTLIKKH